MAIFLQFAKRELGPNGLIPVKRGDDWKLSAFIVEKYSGYEVEVDMTGASATGYFEAASGGAVARSVTVVDEIAGEILIEADKTFTQNIALDPDGQSVYVVITHPDRGEITAETQIPILEVKDREFFTG